ncbi:hypothetical protein ACOME3_010278 [Neoechinorhynchus agilis]
MPKTFDYDTMEALIEYAYTGKLEIKKEKFEDVYFTADRLQMQPIIDACSKYLTESINCGNCLAVRKVLQQCSDRVEWINDYIRNNFEQITTKHREFDRLPRLTVVLKGNSLVANLCYERLVRNVLRWFCGIVQKDDISLKKLPQIRFILSIDGDKCRTQDDLSSDQFKREVFSRKGFRLECHEISLDDFMNLEHDKTPPNKNGNVIVSFDLIHVARIIESNVIGLCIIRMANGGKLKSRKNFWDPDYSDRTKAEIISFHLIPEYASSSDSESNNADVDVNPCPNMAKLSASTPITHNDPVLPPLPIVRSGFGLVTIDEGNTVVAVIGGFNSGSCFRSVEYCEVGSDGENDCDLKWVASKPELKFRRARGYAFHTKRKDSRGFLYALSGGDGTRILASVEKVRTPLKPVGRGSWMTDNSITIVHEKASFLYTPGGCKLYSFGGLKNNSSTAADRCFVNRLNHTFSPGAIH